MNEEYKKEDAGLTTAALAAAGEPTASKLRAGGASTMDGNGVAAAGAATALAVDEQAAPLFSAAFFRFSADRLNHSGDKDL